jgi:IS30 family transposase
MKGHLTLEEREKIAHLHRNGTLQVEIAKRLKRDKSTISRELRRNCSRNGYWATAAQRNQCDRLFAKDMLVAMGIGQRPRSARPTSAKANVRQSQRPWTPKMERPEISRNVRAWLREDWSPDEIAGRLREAFPRDPQWRVSPPTIYGWIEGQGKAGDRWRKHLRRKGRTRREPENRGKIPAATSIAGRPAVVDRRERFGDWEGDTLVGAARRGGAVSLVERKSGFLLLGGVKSLSAETVRGVAGDLYATMPRRLRKTLTLDHGKEFAEHERLAAQTGLKIYFAAPYCAWQRGTNENTNGLIRQYFLKGTDLAAVPNRKIEKVQNLQDNRPRKRLGYKTPYEVLKAQHQVAFEI